MKYFVLFIALCLSLVSCDPKEEDQVDQMTELNADITWESRCGWGANFQIAYFENDQFIYEIWNGMTYELIERKEHTLSKLEVEEVNNLYTFNEFKSIDLDVCGVCYDGCDETLKIKNKVGEEHLVRWDNKDDPAITPMKAFLTFLNELILSL